MRVASYRDLEVWRFAIELVRDIYRLTASYPQSELYGLIGQSRRAGVSIAANISEGHARESTKEFLHFISISLGSVAELETLLLVAQQLDYADTADVDLLLAQTDRIGKMLRGLQKSLRAKLTRPN